MLPRPDEMSARFLLEASLVYEEKCPELSRYLMTTEDKQRSGLLLVAEHWLKPENHRVRLRPKRRPSARVKQVLLRKARGKRLSLAQKKLLIRFQKSSSMV
ncbi:hypothetical protein CCH79_00008879, partial [Gambusia affinis]